MRKSLKKFMSAAVTLAVAAAAFGSMPAYRAEAAEKAANLAEASFGKELVSSGFDAVEMGKTAGAVNVTRSGRNAWLLDKSQGQNKSRINLAFSSEFKHGKNDGSVYEIEVDYYDSGAGYLNIYYDSYINTQEVATTIYTDKTNEWKTAKVTVDDAAFQNHIDGKYDMAIAITAKSDRSAVSSESIAVSGVRVRRLAAQNPIYVTPSIDEVGNTYKWFTDSKIIHNKIENTTDKQQSAAVTFKALNQDSVKVFEKTENLSLAPGEVRDMDIDVGEVKLCGMFKYYIEVTNDDGSINSVRQPFEFFIVKTDPNGIKNDVYYSAHLDRYTKEEELNGLQVIANANVGGLRNEWSWLYAETTPGTIDTKTSKNAINYNNAFDNDLQVLAIIYGYNPLYKMESYKHFPTTPEQMEGFRAFVRESAKELDGKVRGFEIFNEPNINGFNILIPSNDGADLEAIDKAAKAYVDCLKAAYEEVKKVAPNLKVGGPVLCGLEYPQGKNFFDACMRYDMWKYIDALDLHPYVLSYVETSSLSKSKSIEYYVDAIKSAGNEDIEVWYTEMGYTTADKTVGTAYKKGAMNAAQMAYYRSIDMGDLFTLYNLEQKGTIATDREDNFGDVSPGYTDAKKYGKTFVPRESYLIVTAANYFYPSIEPIKSKTSEDETIRYHLFESGKFNTNLLTFYSLEERRNVTVSLGAEEITFGDEYGNETKMHSANGVYTFTADSAPVYILGDISDFEVIEESQPVEYNGSEANSAYKNTCTISVSVGEGDSVEVTAPDCISNLNISDVSNGTVKVSFTNNMSVGGEYKLWLKVKDENGVKAINTVKVSSKQSAAVTASVRLPNSGEHNRWQSEFHIQNYSEENPIKGRIRITEPANFETEWADIGIVPPNATGRVKVHLPEVVEKGEYNIKFTLELDSGEVVESEQKIDFTIAAYAESKPIIDGKGDKGEWKTDTIMNAKNDYQIKQIKDWRGTSDLSAQSCIEWDEDNMYLYCEVADDIFNAPEAAATSYKNDSVQIGIFYGEANRVNIGQANTSFHELCLSQTPDGPAVYRFKAQDDALPLGDITDDCEIAIGRQGGTTIYEFKIPWNKLLKEGQQPKLGDRLGFSFLVNDNDGDGRRGWIEYASGIGEDKNTELFTYLELIDK